jgi:peptidoglycan/LPS O-acetylase OafA/YrhL
LYIMQAPVEHYFEYFFTNNKPFQTTQQFFLYTLVLFALCSALYYLFEIPAKKLILKWWQTRGKSHLSPIVTQ